MTTTTSSTNTAICDAQKALRKSTVLGGIVVLIIFPLILALSLLFANKVFTVILFGKVFAGIVAIFWIVFLYFALIIMK